MVRAAFAVWASAAFLVAAASFAAVSALDDDLPTSTWVWARPPAAGLLPAARGGHGMVAVEGKLYVVGGCMLDVQCFNDVKVYDTVSGLWTAPVLKGTAMEARGGHSVSLKGSSTVVIMGGSNTENTFNDVYQLDLLTNTWQRGAVTAQGDGSQPSPRSNHATAVTGDADSQLYVFGGYSEQGTYLNDLWLLDLSWPGLWTYSSTTFPVQWRRQATSGNVPAPRELHSMTWAAGRLFLFGGFTSTGGLLANDIHVLDLRTMSWSTTGPAAAIAPRPRQGHTFTRHGLELVLAGGCDVNSVTPSCFSDVWTLDARTLAWTPRTTQTAGLQIGAFAPREGHSAAMVRGQLYAFGGCSLGDVCFNDLASVDTHAPCPQACAGHGTCVGGAVCQCTVGFHGHDCFLLAATCPAGCSGHGKCSAAGTCDCETGWLGASCAVEVACPANAIGSKCSGNGACMASGQCDCFQGFSGLDCAVGVASCPKACSGKGTCKSDSTCTCLPGYAGDDCAVALVCPMQCCGKGTCSSVANPQVPSNCLCQPGLHGAACNVPTSTWQMAVQMQSARVVDLRKVIADKRAQAAQSEGMLRAIVASLQESSNGKLREEAKALGLRIEKMLLEVRLAETQLKRMTQKGASDPSLELVKLGIDLATCAPAVPQLALSSVQSQSELSPTLQQGFSRPPTASHLQKSQVHQKTSVTHARQEPEAKLPTAKEFGIWEVDDKGKTGILDAECKDNCNFRGLCLNDQCWCQPGFSGETCSGVKMSKKGTVDFGIVFILAIGVAALACLLFGCVLLIDSRRKLLQERQLGYDNI